MSTTISAPAGFFLNDSVTPDTATDLESAVTAAETNIGNALAAETAAAASATAAASSATTAAGSQSAAASSATAAAASATTATSQATAASGSATTATTQASAAASSASGASSSATAAASSASAAATSATAAGNSATNAATSATSASSSATSAAASAASIATFASVTPAMDGTGTAGSASTVSRGDHQHPRDTSLLAIGRNRLHNPLFTVAQRGTGPFTTGVYSLDRWLIGLTADTVSVTQVALTDTDRSGIGDEEAQFALQNAFTGAASAADFNNIIQRVESASRLSNKSVTLSFWAKASSGTPKIGYSLSQAFGTGGSPSSAVTAIGSGATAALSTTWTRYTATIAVPSVAGKTFGTTAGTDYTALNLWFSSGSTNNAAAGSIGVQSGTVQIWGVQLEVGTAATPLEKRDAAIELALCQRFYQIGGMFLQSYGSTGGSCGTLVPFSIALRATPTLAQSNLAFSNCGSATATGASSEGFEWSFVVTSGPAGAAGSGNFTASADL